MNRNSDNGDLSADDRHELAAEIRRTAWRLEVKHPARQPLLDRALLLQVAADEIPPEELLAEVAEIVARAGAAQ